MTTLSDAVAERAERPLFPPRMAGWRRWSAPASMLIVFVVLAVAPLVPVFDFTDVFNSSSGYGRGNMALVLIYATAVMGFNLLVGWAGQVGLAQAGLFGFGAYLTTEIFAKGVPFPVALAISAVVAAGLGIVVGFPAARLRGFFLAIATLAFGELITKLFELDYGLASWLNTGGNTGRSVPLVTIGGVKNSLVTYYIALVVFAAVFVAMKVLTQGRLGRTLKAIRDQEVVVGAMGISATRYKLIAFGFSAATAALAGGVFAQNVTFINPGAFRTSLLFFLLIILIVGGLGRMWGPLVGAIFYVYLREKLQDSLELSLLIFGTTLVASVLMLPGGLSSLPARIRQSRIFGSLGKAPGG